MNAKDEVLRVLALKATRDIDFKCGKLQINDRAFLLCSNSIRGQSVSCTADAGLLKQMKAEGAYLIPRDRIVLMKTPCANPVDESTVVHEATHCLMDILGYDAPWYQQEAVCFFAGMAFYEKRSAELAYDTVLVGADAFAQTVIQKVPKEGAIPTDKFDSLALSIKNSKGYEKQLQELGDNSYANNGVTRRV